MINLVVKSDNVFGFKVDELNESRDERIEFDVHITGMEIEKMLWQTSYKLHSFKIYYMQYGTIVDG